MNFDWKDLLAGVIAVVAAVLVIYGSYFTIKAINPDFAQKILKCFESAIKVN
jgi:predicted small secreted protein